MPSNPLTQEEINSYAISRALNPEGYTGLSPYMPAGYFLSTPPGVSGPALWRLFDASFISTGIIDPNRLGTGATGAGNLYLADDGTWKLVSSGGGGNMGTSTYDVDNTGVVDNAEAISVIGRNATGSTLYKGTIVYISGSTGNRPNFVKAQANAEATSAGTFGVVKADILNNSDGYVTTIGYLDNLDTRSTATNPFTDVTLADGDTVYLHPTIAGYITNVKPSAPNHLVYVGKVTRTSPTNGTIIYRIQNGYELDEIHDVAPTPYINNGVLYRDTTTNLWKSATIATLLGGTPLIAVPTLATVTTSGNTTTNSISVGGLTVANGAAPIATFNSSNGGGTYVGIQYSGALKAAWGMGGNIIGGLSINDVGFWSSNAMAWEAGGSQRMFLTASGNLLMNTITDTGDRLRVNGDISSTGNIVAETDLKSMYQSGDEGGEIFLKAPATNTTIPNGVTIDVYQNRFRIFQQGGTAKGFYLDMPSGADGVGTNLAPTGYTGTFTVLSNPLGQRNLHITNGLITSID